MRILEEGPCASLAAFKPDPTAAKSKKPVPVPVVEKAPTPAPSQPAADDVKVNSPNLSRNSKALPNAQSFSLIGPPRYTTACPPCKLEEIGE